MSQSDEGSHILAAQDNEEERRKRLFKVTNRAYIHSNSVTCLSMTYAVFLPTFASC
jgi:hypothetical protein